MDNNHIYFTMPENEILNKLAQAVVEVTGIDQEMLFSREKKAVTSMARGVYYLLAKEMGIHPIKTSQFVGRSRASCITTTKQYQGYYDTGDKIVCQLVNEVKEKLK